MKLISNKRQFRISLALPRRFVYRYRNKKETLVKKKLFLDLLEMSTKTFYPYEVLNVYLFIEKKRKYKAKWQKD